MFEAELDEALALCRAREGVERAAVLGGTVVRMRLDHKATTLSLRVAIGVRADRQKILITVKARARLADGARRSHPA